MLRDEEIDWNNDSDEEIINYLRRRLENTSIFDVFKEFEKLYKSCG